MITASIREPPSLPGEHERDVALPLVLAGSLALHVGLVALAPSSGTEHAPAMPRPVSMFVVDVPEEPSPSPSPPPAPEPERPETPAPLPALAERPAPSPRVVKVAPAEEPRLAADAPPPGDDVPVDLTRTVLSNEGAGVAIGGGGGGGVPGGRGHAVTAALPATPVAAKPAGPRLVALADLSRRPRAPSFDAALEKNYPAEARRAGIAGRAVLRIRILPDGRVGNVVPMSESTAGFARACEATVRSAPWEAPLDRDGAAVATEITYTCVFEVRS